MKHFKLDVFLLAVAILFLGVNFFVLLNRRLETTDEQTLQYEIPVLKISLNGVTLEEIRKNDKSIKYGGNSAEFIYNGACREFSNVEIKGRGNSTFGLEKQPYQIKFSEKVDLLNLGFRKKYILLANYVDYSSIRNAMMLKLAEMIDEKYRVRGDFVELYVDDDYRGLYYLTTKIDIEKNAVDLRDKHGVLIELDSLHRKNENCLEAEEDECLILKDAVYEDDEVILKEATDDFLKTFARLRRAAKAGDFKKVSELIDIQSFAEYFLISEFAVNPDAYVSSFYFYKDGFNDKIHAGPLWDYDYAFSNRDWIWGDNDDFYLPTQVMAQKKSLFVPENVNSEAGKLMYYLMEIPEFRFEVDKIFKDKLSGHKEEFLDWTFKEAARIMDAMERDSERWERDSELFYNEVEYILDWMDKRYDFFEKEYGEKEWIFR